MNQIKKIFIAQHATATCCRGCLYKCNLVDCIYMTKEYTLPAFIEFIESEI